MIVVSDTSPVSNLFLVGKLHLLHDIFGDVILPPKVKDELNQLEKFNLDISEIANSTWIKTQIPQDKIAIELLRKNLDAGESEAIILAKEIHADYLLIDEKAGRLAAKQFKIPIIGVLGILKLAKQKNLISSVRSTIDELKSTAGFYISDEVYHQVLKDCNEE